MNPLLPFEIIARGAELGLKRKPAKRKKMGLLSHLLSYHASEIPGRCQDKKKKHKNKIAKQSRRKNRR